MFEWVRFILAAVFILAGLAIAGIGVFGTFRFKYVLNRMHAAALIDTLAILLSLIGLIILSGTAFESTSENIFVIAKMILVVCFLWVTSPVSSHLISRLEVTINEKLEEECEVEE